MSIIFVNEKNGSRTIVHHKKGLLEPTFDEFRIHFENLTKDDDGLAWVHFEGRNVKEARKMIDHVLNWRKQNKSTTPTISVELEKPSIELKVQKFSHRL